MTTEAIIMVVIVTGVHDDEEEAAPPGSTAASGGCNLDEVDILEKNVLRRKKKRWSRVFNTYDC